LTNTLQNAARRKCLAEHRQHRPTSAELRACLHQFWLGGAPRRR